MHSVCQVKPCSFNGVYQPSLLDSFSGGKVVLLSYFYDRLQPFVAASAGAVAPPVRVGTFGELARTVCAGPAAWRARWGADAALMANPSAKVGIEEMGILFTYLEAYKVVDKVSHRRVPRHSRSLMP